MTLPRLSLPLAAALLWTGAVATVPARGSETQLTAVLSLAGRPGDGARLHRLASGRPAPAALRALRPAPAHRTAALRYVRSRHLTVVRSDAWSVTVRGPARDVARAFGATLRSAGATGATGATGAEVPAELRADVRSVAGLDNRRVHQPHALRPHATAEGEGNPQTAASLRTQYDLPTSWRGSGVTVGVLNLAGWNAGDLQAFADREGIPVSPGQVTDVAVGADPAELDGFGSEYEVALDAEAVLGAAPEAKQRLYFAPNTSAGIVSGLQQMAADAEAGLLQVATTSWGSCERDFDLLTTEADREAYRAAIDRMVAAGVTFFAASGDAGAFDCGYPGAPDDEAQVDFPASYPNTVGVGGTTLNAGQPETAWSDQGYDGYLGDGSGGGESVEQPLPAYQAGRLPAAMRRLVPDVSADADPQSGLEVFVGSQGGWSFAGGTSLAAPLWAGMLASGLGSRTTSGDKGLGNILPALYASASQADRPGLVDVTTGNNGLFTASSGYDQVSGLGTPLWSSLLPVLLAASPVAPATGVVSPVLRPVRSVDPGLTVGYTRSLAAPVAVTVPAGANYTGFAVGQDLPGCARLRSTPPTSAQLPADVEQGPVQLSLNALDSAKVCHQVTADIVYDSVAPTVMVTAECVDAQSTQVRLRLRGVDATSGVAAFDVRVRDAVGKLVYYAVSPSATRVLAHLKPGGRYTVQVVARDRAGNVGATTSAVVNVALDDSAFSRSGTWSRLNGTRDYQSSHLQTQQKGAAVTLTAVGKRIDGYLLKGPGQGYADLYVDGRFKARWILDAATTASYRPVLGSWPTAAGRHTVRLVATGLRRPGAVGSYLSVDGVLVVR